MRTLITNFKETFSDIWLWTALCVIGLLPGFGLIPASLIIGILKLVLTALYLNPIAEWLCHSLYCEVSDIWQLMCIDLIRIWMISYILISISRFIYDCFCCKKVPN